MWQEKQRKARQKQMRSAKVNAVNAFTELVRERVHTLVRTRSSCIRNKFGTRFDVRMPLGCTVCVCSVDIKTECVRVCVCACVWGIMAGNKESTILIF